MIRSDPDDAATALEIGLVDEEWLQAPGERPISSSAPSDILRRFLERTVERHPSKLSSLGLTAVQLLSSGSDGTGGRQREGWSRSSSPTSRASPPTPTPTATPPRSR